MYVYQDENTVNNPWLTFMTTELAEEINASDKTIYSEIDTCAWKIASIYFYHSGGYYYWKSHEYFVICSNS